MANTVTGYGVTQIIPAQPDTFALFKDDDGRLLRVPVPAWGMWSNLKEAVKGEGYRLGPLVLHNGRLEPAEETSNFVGVRIGRCVEFNGGTFWDDDDNVQAYESSRSVAAIAVAKSAKKS